MNPPDPHVTIVIVNYGRVVDSLVCLDSLARVTYPRFSIVVVDNGSNDGSTDAIERWSGRKIPVELIRNDINLGFARGSNQGMLHALTANTDYVFLLNNDTVVEPDVLELLVATAEQSDDIGMVGPKIYQYGKENILDSAGTRTIPWLAQGFLLGHGKVDHGQYDNPGEMPYVTGTALLVKRTVLEKIGLMDEDYFCYFEDFDWGMKAREAGYRLLLAPGAVVHHRGSRTAGFGSPFYMQHMVRSRILFARKHIPRLMFVCAFIPYLFLYRYLRPAAILIFHRRWVHLDALHRGIREGFVFPINSRI